MINHLEFDSNLGQTKDHFNNSQIYEGEKRKLSVKRIRNQSKKHFTQNDSIANIGMVHINDMS